MVVGLLIPAICGYLFTAIGAVEAANPTGQPIKLGLSIWAPSFFTYIAQEKGFFEKNNIDVNLTLFQSTYGPVTVFLINDQYEFTRQGKEIFESLMMIEDATKIYYRLNSVDILEGVGEEEIFKLIDRMKFNKGLKQLIIQCRSVFNIGQT